MWPQLERNAKLMKHQNKVWNLSKVSNFTQCLDVAFVDFEQVNAIWVGIGKKIPKDIIDFRL